jgi:hypothetical protein
VSTYDARARKLSFTFAADLTDPQKPNGYNGAMVPAARIDVDLYPMAFGDKRGALAGLGVGLWFEKVIAIKSRLGMTEFPTSQTGFGAGLRYRWNMGHDAKLPTLTAGAGWNYLAFSISTDGVDIDLPDVSYSMIDVGIGGRIPFGMPQIALTLDARYLQILGAGDMQATSAYGGGSKLGFDLDAAIEARLAVRNVIRAGVHYTRIAFDFDGSGEDTTMRDGSPDQDVGGALDQYLGFYATFGYLF